jgi:uncharacterized protein with NAD-binding domain and iron-sulfur cluster
MGKDRIKVAILGGGCGGVSAAYRLSATEELRRTFDVSLYVQGWRLGGKGASGRNAGHHERIEEHGLHMFMGFYEVAFGTLREAYEAQAGKNLGLFPSLEAAFAPQRGVTLWIAPRDSASGDWRPFTINFPTLPGKPGDPEASDFLRRVPERWLDLIAEHLHSHIRATIPEALVSPDLLPSHDVARAHALALRDLDAPPDELKKHHEGLLQELEGFLARGRAARRDLLRGADPVGHLLYDLFELGYAVLHGYVHDVLPWGIDAFDRINSWDFSAWLEHHGASAAAAWSEAVRSVYDLAFAYRNGASTDRNNAAIAAGATLRLCFRMILGYKDAPLWRMNAGMGDTVFSPLFTLLSERGVKFVFFHRVQQIGLSTDGRAIQSIEVSRQVDLVDGRYRPLRLVGGLSCWPSEPCWDQIVDGTQLAGEQLDLESPWCTHEVARRTLTRGPDFDAVVLAIPPAAAGPLTTALASANADWQAMLCNLTAVPTHSVQLWLQPDIAAQDWHGQLLVSTAYKHPLESSADMSHLLARETWGPGGPKSCQYLCGTVVPPLTLPPPGTEAPGFQAGQNAAGKTITDQWTAEYAGRLWPSAAGSDGKGLDWSLVVDSYDHVNIAYSELYVQTFPDSVQYRLDPGWNGFTNLALAGDWTISSINGGSAEAAFESGKRAAEAIIARFPRSTA